MSCRYANVVLLEKAGRAFSLALRNLNATTEHDSAVSVRADAVESVRVFEETAAVLLVR